MTPRLLTAALLLLSSIEMGCRKNSSVDSNHNNVLDTFLAFDANGISYRWADTIFHPSGADTPTIEAFIREQPKRLTPLPTYAFFLTGGIGSENCTIQLNTNPAATAILPGTYTYVPGDTAFQVLSGYALFSGSVWTWLVSDTVTITTAFAAYATGTFSATLEHTDGDTTELLHITKGIFQNLPITP
jgi:hypothetical protein